MSATVHLVHDGMLFLLLIYGVIALIKPVTGSSLALCEGGQTCLPPKECCAQGCCYLYAPPGAPRVPMANNDHVLSLLFVNHWYFWCFVLAIVLALLCTCSLWKKRRQLCGWDTSARHSQSEGDSAGSCYAPPQYSRCNSFHIHAPPPYTEVASKPDLYPLVFSYTDPGKGNGANYLMVQYFRNYIVQPVGSISGTSTVDSLSSSFICNANEANTLVPPPYSRAASPDLTMSFRNYLMPRSASQQVCLTAYDRPTSGVQQGSRSQASYQRDDDSLLDHHHHHHQQQQQQQSQCILSREQQRDETGPTDGTPVTSTINHNSISSNNVSLMECPGEGERGAGSYHPRKTNFMDHGPSQQAQIGGSNTSPANQPANDTSEQRMVAGSTESFTSLPGPPFEGSLQARNSNTNHPANRYTGRPDGTSVNCDLNILQANFDHQRNTLMCKLCCSMGDITAGTPSDRRIYHTKDLSALHKSLETCCHVNLHGNREGPRPGLSSLQPTDSEDSMMHTDVVRKHDARMRNSCGISSVGSNVSSLVNLDASSSPPRATSPTAEVRELLEQIRLLHSDGTDAQGTSSSSGQEPSDVQLFGGVATATQPRASGTVQHTNYRRPSSLIGRRNKLWSKPSTQHGGSKGMYIPISFTQSFMAPGTNGRNLRSPASMSSAASSFLNRGRSRYCWMSKSAPTTPGAAPGSFAGGTLGDNRPLLLTEQEEDGEQNV
uniref:WW domain binding protein VOPP1 n=1 Tax=Anopheles culicifacies TaxID=139723 RepID=A0A182LRL7_9DIPT